MPFYFTVIKLYLRLELIKEPTLYNVVEYVKPARIDEPVFLL